MVRPLSTMALCFITAIVLIGCSSSEIPKTNVSSSSDSMMQGDGMMSKDSMMKEDGMAKDGGMMKDDTVMKDDKKMGEVPK